MAILETRTVPERNLRSNDPLTTGTQDVPDGATDVTIRPTGADWSAANAGITVTVTLEQSLDGGATWNHLCSHAAVPGTLGKDGGPAPIKCSFRAGATTRLRATFAPTANIRLGATVAYSDGA